MSESSQSNLFQRLKRHIRQPWRELKARARLVRYSWYDFKQFQRFSGAINKRDSGAQAAQIIKYYHMIEKGLALPMPRPGFGHYAIESLCDLVAHRLRVGDTSPYVVEAIEVLAAYRDFNSQVGGATPACVAEVMNLASLYLPFSDASAVKRVERSAIAHATDFDALAFFNSRYSVRQFSTAPVDRSKIETAARIAQTAPSVCNRQAGRLHIVTNQEIRNRFLNFQNGNRGFGETIGALAVVTVDLRSFVEPEERFQGWIDGGLFAMSFILGLHSQGLGTCCLNWSSPSANDRDFHSVSGIPDHESVIMFLAIGELRDEFHVARSPRKPFSDILSYIG